MIEEKNRLADVVFPLRPLVVSLQDYDAGARADLSPINGYPVICVTVSNNFCGVLFMCTNLRGLC